MSDARPHSKKHLAALCIIVAVVLLVRSTIFLSVYSAAPSRMLRNDSSTYDLPARALLKTGRLAVDPDAPDSPMIIRTPGYPCFIALVYLVFGENHAPVGLAQIVLSAVTVVMVYYMSRTLWDSTAALAAATLFSLDLVSLVSSLYLLTETLFTFFLTASVGAAVLLGVARRGRGRYAFLSGLLLALATLVRPIAYYLVGPMVVGWFVYGCLAGWKRKEILAVVLLTGLPWVVLVGGWQVRNYRVSGSFEFSHIKNINILYYRAAGVVAQREGIEFAEAADKLKRQYPKLTRREMSAELLESYGREGFRIVARHPFLFMKDQWRGVMKTLTCPQSSRFLIYLGYDPASAGQMACLSNLPLPEWVTRRVLRKPLVIATTAGSWAFLVISYAAMLCSLWNIARRERQALVVHVLILGVILYLLIVGCGPETNCRFRTPLAPFIALYAGRGLALFVGRYRRRRARATV